MRIQLVQFVQILFSSVQIRLVSAVCVSAFMFGAVQSYATNPIWCVLQTGGQPMASYYLGDTMGSYYINVEIGQDSWNQSDVGIGQSSTGSGENWSTADWYADDGSNKKVRRDLSGFQFTATGSWYVYGRVREGSGDAWTYTYKLNTWTNGTTFGASEYFTVDPLQNPSPSAATGAGTPTSEIDLSWTKWNSKNVMIVRSLDSNFTAPADGTPYSVNDTIGGDTVIYNGSDTSLTDTGLTSGTTYYYKFYSENYSYYSAGATAHATTDAAPQPSIGHGPATLSYTMTRGALPSDQSFAVTNAGGGTLTYTNTVAYGAGASGWLSLSIANSSLAASATESTTVSVTQSNLTAGTYYATNTITGNQTNGTKTVVIDITVSDVVDPTLSSIAVNATYPATRVDLNWAKNGDGDDVMIVRSADASFTAPTDTATYNVNDLIDGDTVIYRGSATTFEDTGRLEGVTYHYKLYSEYYTYYSSGTATSVTTGYAQTRNTSGGAVEEPSVAIHLGDTAEFGCDSWASIDGDFGRWQVVIDTDADLSDGSAGGYSSYTEIEHKTNTSARFTSVGTWYWGMQVDYGATHGAAHWYVSDSAAWGDMATTPTSSLTVDVLALPVVTGQSATTNGVGNPTNEIALAWTPQATPTTGNYQVMIVRKVGSAPSAPTQGTSYSVNAACGGGTVVYKGFDSSFTDTGLSEGTTYHYAFYSENYSYYSASATANATTAGNSGSFVPTPTVFSFK